MRFNVLFFCLFAFVDMSISFSVTCWFMSFDLLSCYHVIVLQLKKMIFGVLCALTKKGSIAATYLLCDMKRVTTLSRSQFSHLLNGNNDNVPLIAIVCRSWQWANAQPP